MCDALRRILYNLVFRFTSQERLKIVFLINSVVQENKMRHRHEELRLQREKMTAHMVRKSQTLRCNVERIYDPQLLLLFGRLREKMPCGERSFKLQGCQSPFLIPSFFAIISLKQNECLEEVTKHEEEVRVFHETYDAVVAEDKVCQHGKNNNQFALAHAFYKCTKKITSVFLKGC